MEWNNLTGYVAEYKVIALLIEKSFHVSVPCDPYCSYDLIIDNNNKLLRIQVKSCSTFKRGRYRVDVCYGATNNKKAYKVGSFEFFIIFLPSENCWYIIPSAVVGNVKMISLYPKNKEGKYEKYKENWELLSL